MSIEQNPSVEKVSDKLRQLLDAAIESAKSTMQGGQGILPCSIALDRDEKIRLAIAAVGGMDGSNQLAIGLRGQATSGEITAAAVYREVRVRIKGQSQDVDAIHVFLEESTGQAFHVFQVYRKDTAGNYAYDQVVVEQGAPSIFLSLQEKALRKKSWWEFWK